MSAVYIDPAILWARVLDRIMVSESGCWLWQGAITSRGYGCIGSGAKGKNITTHRLAVLVRDGELADDLTVDHQCHDSLTCKLDADCPHRRCVNPAHLKIMTRTENTARRWAEDKCTRAGHPLTWRPDRRSRQCLACRRESARKSRAAA